MFTPWKKLVCIVAAAAAFAACTGPENTERHYIRLSDASCVFNGADNLPLQLTVITSPTEWSAESHAAWIELSDKGKNTITVKVVDNPDNVGRKGYITFKAGEATSSLEVTQLPADEGIARYRQLLMFQLGAKISPSGKYVTGFYATLAEDESVQYHPVIIDLATDERIQLGPYPASLAALWEPTVITDQGLAIFDTEAGGPMAFDLEGSYYRIKTPAGFVGTPSVSNASADGKYWVGYSMKRIGGEGLYVPVKWTDQVAEMLQMPEKSYRGLDYVEDAALLNGVMARGISANGEIIYGSTWDNKDFGMIYWDQNGDVHWVGEDVRRVKEVDRKDPVNGGSYKFNLVDGITTTSNDTQISPNGKWIAGTYRGEELAANGEDIDEVYRAAFYNTETKKTYIIEDYGESTARGVTDDGLGFIAMGYSGISSGVVYDIEKGMELGKANEWLEQQYGVVVPSGYLEYIGGDVAFGCSVVSGAMGAEDCYWYVAPRLEE